MPNNDRPIVPINRSSFDSAYGIGSKAAVGSSPKFSIDRDALEHFLDDEPAIVQKESVQDRVARYKQEAKQALLNIATQRKVLYDIILDLKEHFHEYGYKSAAAAVEDVIQRSKRWANRFIVEIESELEIEQVGNFCPTEPDRAEQDKEAALNKINKLPDPTKPTPATSQSEPNGDGGSAGQSRHTPAGQPAANGSTPKPRTENGKATPDLLVWKLLEEGFGKLLPLIDRANHVHPDKIEHAWLLQHTGQCMEHVRAWRAKK